MTRGRAAFSLDGRSPYLLWSRAQKPRERVERDEIRNAAGAHGKNLQTG